MAAELQVAKSFSTKEAEASFRELKADLTNMVKECRALHVGGVRCLEGKTLIP